MPNAPVSHEQLARWRAVFDQQASLTLRATRGLARRCVMRMMQVAEQLAADGVSLSDDVCRTVFFQSTTPGFVWRDDQTVQACARMMRQCADESVCVAK